MPSTVLEASQPQTYMKSQRIHFVFSSAYGDWWHLPLPPRLVIAIAFTIVITYTIAFTIAFTITFTIMR